MPKREHRDLKDLLESDPFTLPIVSLPKQRTIMYLQIPY
jgi:hypothetical protein